MENIENMKNAEDTEIQLKAPPKVSDLEDVLHNYLTLHALLEEEQAKLTKQNIELGKTLIRLSAEVTKLQSAEETLKKEMSSSIRQAATDMGIAAGEKFKEEVMQDVEYASKALTQSSDKHVSYLRQAEQDKSNQSILFSIGLFVLPIIASLLIFWWLSPKPTVPLTDQQLGIYQDGQALRQFWPKLNKKQQQWLTDLANGKIKNHGKPLDENRDNAQVDDNSDNNGGYPIE